MNIYHRIYIILLAVIIGFLCAIYLEQKQSHKDATAFAGWLQTNYETPYEEISDGQ